MECRLSSSGESWSCQISIRWEFENDGKPKNKVQEHIFGPLITNKADVELYLRRAQSAVLNPSTDSAKFLGKTARDLKSTGNELKFSRNTVCVQLSGPELTDLAFVDLPGVPHPLSYCCEMLTLDQASSRTNSPKSSSLSRIWYGHVYKGILSYWLRFR